MISKSNIRQRLIQRIKKLSDDKLSSVENYINSLENDIKNKTEVLSFAGIFSDLDSETFEDLTSNLKVNRQKGISRIQ